MDLDEALSSLPPEVQASIKAEMEERARPIKDLIALIRKSTDWEKTRKELYESFLTLGYNDARSNTGADNLIRLAQKEVND